MYRKRNQKRGGWPEFLDQALEQAKEKASALTQSVQSATTEGIEKTNELGTATVMTDVTPVPVVEGGKSRRKKRTKRKRTKRRSSVRQRR